MAFVSCWGEAGGEIKIKTKIKIKGSGPGRPLYNERESAVALSSARGLSHHVRWESFA